MKNITCINCYKIGHTFKDCKEHIVSYGILGYRWINGILKFILIQRRNTIGYIDFIRGKYDDYKNLIDEMTLTEKYKILNNNFDQLWDDIWLNHNSKAYKVEYNNAKSKFINLDIHNIISSTLPYTKWDHEEYCIPKGRRNNNETQVHCAIREFIEETGFQRYNFNIINNYSSIEELFYGSNGVPYKHIYYIAKINTDIIPSINTNNILQAGEVKNIKWFSYKEAMNVFRCYESTKRFIINNVYSSLIM